MKPVATLLIAILVFSSCQSNPELETPTASECDEVTARREELAQALLDAQVSPVPTVSPGIGIDAEVFAKVEQSRLDQRHRDRVAAKERAFWEESAVLARQHPDCFTVEERSQLETYYQRIRDERISDQE